MIKKTRGFLCIKDVNLKQDYNEDFKIVVNAVFDLETNIDKKQFRLEICKE